MSSSSSEFDQYQERRQYDVQNTIQELLDVETPIYKVSKGKRKLDFAGLYKQTNIECDYPIFQYNSYQLKYNLDRKQWCLYNDLDIHHQKLISKVFYQTFFF